jgi:hypothetical protein
VLLKEGKENDGRGEFKYDTIDNIVRTFVNATMYPYPAQQFKKNSKRD